MSVELSFVFSQYTRVTDRQTDRQTDGRHYDHEGHACIQCSAVKTNFPRRKASVIFSQQHILHMGDMSLGFLVNQYCVGVT